MVSAVLVAAGSGERLGAGVPKALVDLGGRPIVRRAVDALARAGINEIVVTAPASHVDDVADALAGTAARVVPGGQRRQDSVSCGLAELTCEPDAIVLVHDAARPLVSAGMIRRVIDAVDGGAEAVVPARAVIDTVRQLVDPTTNITLDRTRLRAVQTPQGFRFATLVRAHASVSADGLSVTDDAAAAEHIGCAVEIVDGDPNAFKITEPLDLILAAHLLEVTS